MVAGTDKKNNKKIKSVDFWNWYNTTTLEEAVQFLKNANKGKELLGDDILHLLTEVPEYRFSFLDEFLTETSSCVHEKYWFVEQLRLLYTARKK